MTNNIKIFLPEKGKKIVFLTGAGVSTHSGIPDFRSDTGIYATNKAQILSWQYFHEKPKKFYDFFFNTLYNPDKKPNIVHNAIKELENDYDVFVITQNVDGFHTEAGSSNVIEFHGNSQYVVCTRRCSFREPTENWIDFLLDEKSSYVCPLCNKGKIKPDVVLFGEQVTHFNNKSLDLIRKEMLSASSIFVLGTSLQVYPFASFVDFKHEHTTGVIVSNNPPNREGFVSYDMDLVDFVNKI
jgi:NAD-dependent deacetylase